MDNSNGSPSQNRNSRSRSPSDHARAQSPIPHGGSDPHAPSTHHHPAYSFSYPPGPYSHNYYPPPPLSPSSHPSLPHSPCSHRYAYTSLPVSPSPGSSSPGPPINRPPPQLVAFNRPLPRLDYPLSIGGPTTKRRPPPRLDYPLSPGQKSAYSPPHYYTFPYHQGPKSPGVSSQSSQSPISSSPRSPSLENVICNVQISDSKLGAPASPSAPASPPAPAAQTGPFAPHFAHSNSVPFHGRNDEFNGCSDKFSGRRRSTSDVGDLKTSPSVSNESPRNQSLQLASYKGSSLRALLLHGNLDIWIHEANNLPNLDMFHRTLGDMFGKMPGSPGKGNTSDPYVSIRVSSAVIGRTFVIKNCEDPVWEQHFCVPVAHNAAEVIFHVKDSDVVGSELIGVVAIPVEQIHSGEVIKGAYPILNSNGKPVKQGAVLSLTIQYTPIDKLVMYQQGVGAGPEYIGVPGTYFPLRRGGTVTLYQDAHVPDGCLPNLMLDNEMHYVHGKCWFDIFQAISQAQRLIYITGWSVWHKVQLIRDAGPTESLGHLLRSKSQEGVRVLLLVWDDPTSRNILGIQTDGLMATHDEETRKFFKHSSVQVQLCSRNAGKRHSWAKQKEIEAIYTHHQKTVMVDAAAGNGKRKIIAFVGGLDLCDGRYDNPYHPLFRTLQTLHKDDYHNPCFAGNTGGCLREPWHDLHSKIDGPAAYDVLANFEERWLRAAKPKGVSKVKGNAYDDALLRLERIQDFLTVNDVPSVDDDNPEAWHVQIFRSIDSNSVKGFPKDPKIAQSMVNSRPFLCISSFLCLFSSLNFHRHENVKLIVVLQNLVCRKNVMIDMSIHEAYVKAIRSAQHYIYIENQYFIGSSFNWSQTQYKDLGADNLIPIEIALKIAEKIRENQRFAVYIVIPMWPEGIPTGAATQRILYWQNKTMQNMYQTVYNALVETGLETAFSPQDYLNFFCLGNREACGIYENVNGTGAPPPANSPQAQSRNNGRFMIYVHSKGMIVDDEYVIIGSANINQRSMDGGRDTEIAMGAYQPHHTWARNNSAPRGQVHGYRMSLWAEHTGTIEECFFQPESLECVSRVRTMGELNWKQYSAKEVSEMRGHLMKYPVDVDRKGKIKPIPGFEEFPDVGGKIVGSCFGIQENLTI
ncbi:Phospholipase D beta [Arachis hypogaea]|nr:Phospholipase D beta [Arachis hypogaea]